MRWSRPASAITRHPREVDSDRSPVSVSLPPVKPSLLPFLPTKKHDGFENAGRFRSWRVHRLPLLLDEPPRVHPAADRLVCGCLVGAGVFVGGDDVGALDESVIRSRVMRSWLG